MFELPTSIEINNKSYKIRNKGDYRMVVDCFKALADEELDKTMRVLSSLVIFYDELESEYDIFDVFGDSLEEAVLKMYDFFNCGEENIGSTQHHKLIDWDKDSQLISSAINKVSNIEIRSVEYCHWWTFMGYYLSVGESALSTVVSIRNKIATHKSLDKWEKDFKKDNPNYFIWDMRTVEEKELDDAIRKIWNNE